MNTNSSPDPYSIVAGGKTQKQINDLKAKHGPLTLVTIEDQHWWFKKPDMNVLSASAKVALENPMESTLIYFRNCLVDGDPKACENVDLWVSIAPHLNGLIEEQKVEVKKF